MTTWADAVGTAYVLDNYVDPGYWFDVTPWTAVSDATTVFANAVEASYIFDEYYEPGYYFDTTLWTDAMTPPRT